VINHFYINDDDVIQDKELQNWAFEIYEVGFEGIEKGWPKSITSVEQLIKIITTFIWTVSPQHAVLNFTQYDNFAFIPAAPPALYVPPPAMREKKWKKGDLKMEELYKALPPKAHSSKQIALVYILSQYSGDDVMLGSYPENLFTESIISGQLGYIQEFREELETIGIDIEKRKHWAHFHPKRIPNSTAI